MSLASNEWILAIADDLTGALEVGAKFASLGIPARVETETAVAARPPTPVLVIDTETRHLSANAAFAIVRETVSQAQRFKPWLVYKKTDSTLRGNIGAEFRALSDALPQRALIYAPAYPAMGRTVRGGHLLVHGIPVGQTQFALDLFNPVRESKILELLEGCPATVRDGESDADLASAALEIVSGDPPPLAAGPAALAEALATLLAPRREAFCPLPRLSRCLVVNGSMHPISAAQIEHARAHGCLKEGWLYFEGHLSGSGRDRASQTGVQVRQTLEASEMQGLVVFGGDTAFGVHQALGAPAFHSCGELAPGVPLSRCGDLYWITKAGGFGAPPLLCDIQRRLP